MKVAFRVFILAIIAVLYVFEVHASEKLDKVSIQLDWIFQYQYAGFIAAKEMGYYRDAGLDVELREYKSGLDTVGDVLSQKANYGINNASIVINNEGRVVPIILLATYLQRSPLVFVASPNIKSPRDFVGKRIMGTTDELRYSSLALLLAHFDIGHQNADFVEHTFKVDDFADKRVDVMTAFRSNQLYEMDNRKIAYNIIDPADYGFYMSAVNVFSSREEALNHPERTQKFIEATNLGWAYALDHAEEIIDLIYEKYSQRKSKEALSYEADVTYDLMLLDLYPIGQANEELSLRSLKQLRQSRILEAETSLGRFLFQDVIRSPGSDIRWTPEERLYIQEKQKITMCVDPNWMPYEKIDNNGKHVGLIADFMEELSSISGLPIDLVKTGTWAETLEKFKHKECDIISGLNPSPDRKTFMEFTPPLFSSIQVIITRNDEFYIEDLSDLDDKPLALIKGYRLTEILKQKYPRLNILLAESESQAFSMVSSGQAYATVSAPLSANYLIKTMSLANLKVSGNLNIRDAICVGVQQNDAVLLSIMSKAVNAVAREKSDTFFQKWISIPFEQRIQWRYLIKYIIIALLLLSAILLWNRKLSSLNRRLLELKQSEEQKNRELMSALDEIKTLEGIVPICSFCKQIRDDKGYWNQVESYVAQHTEAEFSHGICPKCIKQHYPDLEVNERTQG